jgi:integrase
MLLLMATLGMGAAEVINLRLGDIDWRASVLRARRPKTSVPIELPLLPNVAKAIAAYLKQSRPRSTARREVFLTMRMPYRPLSSSVLRHQIREYARRGGVQASVLGSHLFRHSHATRQIDTGADLQVVSSILGHRRPSSTSTYVRVALRRLRAIALPVPR